MCNKKRTVYKPISELRYGIVEDGDVYLFFRTAKFYCAMSLKEIIEMYPETDLFLCHQSRLVNEKYISKDIPFNHELITMENGVELEVSYRIKKEIKPLRFKNWMQYLIYFRLKKD